MDKAAVIEIGTNSVKFYAAKKGMDRIEIPLTDEVEITRLGQGMGAGGLMTDEAMERTARAAARFAASAAELGIIPHIIGTMALRTAKNSLVFIERVRELTGLELRIISGEEEARLSCLAVSAGLPTDDVDMVIFDTGGGSTEIIREEQGKIAEVLSLPLGAGSVSEKFFASDPPAVGAVASALAMLRRALEEGGVSGAPRKLVGVGGAAVTLASVKLRLEKYDPRAVRGTVVTLPELEEMAALFASLPLGERKKIKGMPPSRAEIILAGTCIVMAVMETLGVPSFTVTDRGLRHGAAGEIFAGKFSE